MMKRTLGIAFGLITLLSACGSSSDGSKGTTTSPSTAANKGKFSCAKDTCVLPDSLKGEELCCMDPFAGGCGIKAGGSCRAFPEVDSRCPAPDLMPMGAPGMAMVNFKAFGCCTSKNECGIDFGMGGCQATTSLCRYVTKDEAASLKPTTCDGEAIELPANCGQNGRPMFPGAAGSGAAAAGSGS